MVNEPKGKQHHGDPSKLPSRNISKGTPSSDEEAQNANPAYKTSNNLMRRFVAILDEHDGAITAVATIVIAVLTFFYVRYARYQWAVLSKQLTELQASTINYKSSERGYVVVKKMTLSALPAAGKELAINGEIVNSGQTPAIGVRIAYDLKFQRTALPEMFPYADLPKEEASVIDYGAGVTLPLTMTTEGATLNPQMIEALHKGEYKIYGIGRITYTDIFGSACEVRFCAFWDGADVSMISCPNPEYNSLKCQ